MSQDESSAYITLLQSQLGRLVRIYELCDQACSALSGITTAQGYTLLALPEKGYLTMNGLSETMELANSTMTRMVDQLVQKGLVRRKPDAEDRRIVLIGLTDEGRAMRTNLEQSLHAFFGQVVAGLEENERPAMLRCLERITALLKEAFKSCC